MKIYKTQRKFEAEVKDGKFYSEESIDVSAFNLITEADIEVDGDIKAKSIKAGSIKTEDINANDINVPYITARDVNVWNINAWRIRARDIKYYAVVFAYESIECRSIKGGRKNSRHFVLDGKISIHKCEKLTHKIFAKFRDLMGMSGK